jgi:hypothetical protein
MKRMSESGYRNRLQRYYHELEQGDAKGATGKRTLGQLDELLTRAGLKSPEREEQVVAGFMRMASVKLRKAA